MQPLDSNAASPPSRGERAASLAAWFLVAVALSGCVTTVERLTLSVDEYEGYRRFRVASSVERKLAASYEYLRAHPTGTYRTEVRAWFAEAQPPYIDRSWNDAGGLERFLALVPAGPEAERAARRLVELRLSAEYRARHEAAFDAKVAKLESRLAKAAAGRRELVSGVVGWSRKIAAIRSWGVRTSELDSELIQAYRLTAPEARCDETSCTKTLVVSYDVPEGKEQSARQAVYDVVLQLENGGVQRASITGPELFTRMGEAVRVAAVGATDLVGRAEAIGQAAQVLALAVEPVMPAARCAAEAVSPVVLRRTCDGVDLRVISAIELGEEDRIVVEPLPVATPAASAPRP